jgi:hypothetical protein
MRRPPFPLLNTTGEVAFLEWGFNPLKEYYRKTQFLILLNRCENNTNFSI